MSRLAELRDQVDDVNHRLLAVLNERGKIIRQIGKLKAEAGLPLRDIDREQQQLCNLLEHNDGPYSDGEVERFFSVIFSASLDLMLRDSEPCSRAE